MEKHFKRRTHHDERKMKFQTAKKCYMYNHCILKRKLEQEVNVKQQINIRSLALQVCNTNDSLTQKIYVISLNLRGYDGDTKQDTGKFE